MMKIYWRWIKILLTCGLGRHAPMRETLFPSGVHFVECTRCHHATYSRAGLPKDVHLRPAAWDVARGLYDQGIQS